MKLQIRQSIRQMPFHACSLLLSFGRFLEFSTITMIFYLCRFVDFVKRKAYFIARQGLFPDYPDWKVETRVKEYWKILNSNFVTVLLGGLLLQAIYHNNQSNLEKMKQQEEIKTKIDNLIDDLEFRLSRLSRTLNLIKSKDPKVIIDETQQAVALANHSTDSSKPQYNSYTISALLSELTANMERMSEHKTKLKQYQLRKQDWDQSMLQFSNIWHGNDRMADLDSIKDAAKYKRNFISCSKDMCSLSLPPEHELASLMSHLPQNYWTSIFVGFSYVLAFFCVTLAVVMKYRKNRKRTS